MAVGLSVLAAVVIPTAAFSAGDSTSALVSSVGFEEAVELSQDLQFTDPAAAAELPREDLSRDQVLDLLDAVFKAPLEGPSAPFVDLDVDHILSAHAAVLDTPTASSSSAVSALAEGGADSGGPGETVLLESATPLVTTENGGEPQPVDLGLESTVDGLQPTAPLVDLAIPSELGEGIELPDVGITVALPGAAADRGPSVLGEATAVYPNIAPDTDFSVVPTPAGMETFTVLRGPDSPLTQKLDLDLPEGAELRTDSGGAKVFRADETILKVHPPTAFDAAGKSVPVELSVDGDALTLAVTPGNEVQWPILLDPLFEVFSQLGPWGSAPGWTATKNSTALYAGMSWTPPGQSGYSGLRLMANAGQHNVGNFAQWAYSVPRLAQELEAGRFPESFIVRMSLGQVYYLTSSGTSSPYLINGIWDTATDYWVGKDKPEAFWAYPGNAPSVGPKSLSFENGNAEKRSKHGQIAVGLALWNNEPASTSAAREAYLGSATIEVADEETPGLSDGSSPQAWVNQVASQPISAVAEDYGLGVKSISFKIPGNGTQTVTNPCIGTSANPCPYEWSASIASQAYSPSLMPQGFVEVPVTAKDVIGNTTTPADTITAQVRVDHTKPSLTLSGPLTEQATLGTKLPAYNLKFNATDGDTATPEPLSPIGSAGTGAGKFERASFPALDSSGNLFVSDRVSNRITKFDSSGSYVTNFGVSGSANGQLNDVRGLAVSASGNVWAADWANHRVQRFSSAGAYQTKIDLGAAAGPYAVATAPNEFLWVVDQNQKTVSKYKEDGTFWFHVRGTASDWGSSGTDLLNPVGAAVDASGNVWVVDQGNSKIRQFGSSTGVFRFEFGVQGTAPGQLNHPRGIAIAPSGNLLITDESHRVQEFMPDGTYLNRSMGSSGSGSGQLLEPQGIAIGSDNKLYVGDAGNKRVARWAHADLDFQSGVRKVEIKVDGQTVRPPNTQTCGNTCPLPGEWTLDAGDYSTGQHKLEVIATDGVDLTEKQELPFQTTAVPLKISVSGTMTEQAELGTTRPNYKLKVDASAGTGSGPPAPLPGLTAAYSFDAGSGAVAKDSVANHDGTIAGGAAWAEGKFGKALKFDGTNDCVSIPNSVDLQLSGAFTLEAWVNPDNATQWAPIFFKEGEGFYSYSLFFGAFSAGHLQGYVADEPYEWTEVESPGTLAANTWSHVGMTSDGTTLKLYVNGTLVDTASAKDAMESNKPLWIGCSGIWAEKFLGKIDEARIYNRALSQEEINTDKDQAIGTAAPQEPVAAYSFDAGSGTAVADVAGANDNGTTAGGPTWAEGKFGKALKFDGSDDCLSVPNSLDLQLRESFTLEAWVNPTTTSQGSPVFFKEAEGFYSYSLFFGAFNAGHVQGYIADAPWEWTEVESPGTLAANTWSHIAMTSDRTTMKLYVNGNLVDSSPASDAMESNKPLYIGCSGMWSEKFKGLIDEARIYNRALSQEEVKADKDAAIGAGTKATTEISFDGQVVASGQTSCLGTYCPISKEWELDATGKSVGAHQLVAKVTDGSGSVRTKSLTVNVAKDTTVPTITGAEAFYSAPEGWVEQKPYAVNATGKDEAGYGVTSMTLKIDGEVVRSSSQGCPAGGCNLQMAAGQPIDMAGYDGGAHTAELRVVDGAGNVAKKAWTISVVPTGAIGGNEAIDTLAAVETTDPEAVLVATSSEVFELPLREAGVEPEFEMTQGEFVSSGAPVETRVLPETGAVTIEGADGPIDLEPVDTEGEENSVIAGGAAVVTPGNGVDSIVRPIYNGAMVFSSIRTSESPEEFRWQVNLPVGQTLQEVNAEQAEIVHENGKRAALISAEPAHDATGKAVPTSLSVDGSELVLLVEHQGASVTYPVIAGPSFETGYSTVVVADEIEAAEEEEEAEEEELDPPSPQEIQALLNFKPGDQLTEKQMKRMTRTMRPVLEVGAPLSGGTVGLPLDFIPVKGKVCMIDGCSVWYVEFTNGNFTRVGRGVKGTRVEVNPSHVECIPDWSTALSPWIEMEVFAEGVHIPPSSAWYGQGKHLTYFCKFHIEVSGKVPYPGIPGGIRFGNEDTSSLMSWVYHNGYQQKRVRPTECPWWLCVKEL